MINFKEKPAGTYASFYQTGWTSIIDDPKKKFNAGFGIEVVAN